MNVELVLSQLDSLIENRRTDLVEGYLREKMEVRIIENTTLTERKKNNAVKKENKIIDYTLYVQYMFYNISYH